MRDAVDGLSGRRLRLDAYLEDFDTRFWALRDGGVWKLERQQHFQQPESPSWTAFARGDWKQALQLLERDRAALEREFREIAGLGVSVRRVRVVEEPIAPYLHWELHSLNLRAQCGENIRVVGPRQVTPFESEKRLPEIVTLGQTVLYKLLYTEGLLDGAVLFTDPDLVAQCRGFIERLYDAGEDLASFFTRTVGGLASMDIESSLERSGSEPDRRTSAEISGSAGQAVQAQEVHGGVHFYGPSGSSRPAPRQLPGDIRGFVNRVSELERLSAFLADENQPGDSVYVIAGTAGVGKTALALHWAHQVRDRFPDGQLYVNLRGYDPGRPVAPEQVLDRFLRALDVPSHAIPADLESQAALYRSFLADRRVLVVLDNAATVRQIRPLLPGASSCLVLITSRDRLSGLVVRDGAQRLNVGTLAPSAAVTLLETVTARYRARDNGDEVAELARLCARLPLALRIAAERAASHPHMPLSDLIQDLRDESSLWDALTVDDEEEADAVRTVFAWSYRALPERAARLFRVLGIHPGPEFSTRAAAVLAGTTIRQVRQELDVLGGAYLLDESGPDRYQFHDLLRAYAVDQAQHEETPESRREILHRLLTWYLRTAHAAASVIDSQLRPLPLPPLESDLLGDLVQRFSDHGEAIRWYETERENLVAATHAAASAGLHHIAWQLPVVLRQIYAFRTPVEEWIATGLLGLDAARHVGARSGEADLLESLGMAYVQAQRTAEGIERHREALAIRREIGDEFGGATALNGIGLALLRSRRLTDARAHFEQCLTLVRGLGERRWEGIALGNLADACFELGELRNARDFAEQALLIHRETGNKVSECACLLLIGSLQGQPDQALPYIQRALDVAHELDNPVREAYVFLELGDAQLAGGLLEDALVSYHRAASLQRRIGDIGREAAALDGTGNVYRELGRLGEAADFYRRAVAGYRKRDDHWHLALCLDHLATVLDGIGKPDEAQRHWREAVALLATLTDPQAGGLRRTIDEKLAGASGS